MERPDREYLNNQSSRKQDQSLRDAALILGVLTVFIVGLIAGGLLFAFGGNASRPKNFDDGKTALALFLNGIANTGQR
jgi:hypothetical protein